MMKLVISIHNKINKIAHWKVLFLMTLVELKIIILNNKVLKIYLKNLIKIKNKIVLIKFQLIINKSKVMKFQLMINKSKVLNKFLRLILIKNLLINFVNLLKFLKINLIKFIQKLKI